MQIPMLPYFLCRERRTEETNIRLFQRCGYANSLALRPWDLWDFANEESSNCGEWCKLGRTSLEAFVAKPGVTHKADQKRNMENHKIHACK